MAEDQFTHNSDPPPFFYNKPYLSPELSRLPSSSSSIFSSVTRWDDLKSDFEQEHHHGFNNNNDCMDFMENMTWDNHVDNNIDVYDYETIENTSDFHRGVVADKSDFFQDNNNTDLDGNIINVSDYLDDASGFQHRGKQVIVVADDDQAQQQQEQEQDEQSDVKIKRKGSKDLAAVFLKWLKANKGVFSAEDLRKVKLKRSTIESSIERFGGGEQGMKRLLVLILEWVQKHHIHKDGNKRAKTLGESSSSHTQPNPGPSPIFTAQTGSTNDPNGGVPRTIAANGTWLSAMVGNTGAQSSIIDFNTNPYQPPTGDCSWSPSQFAMQSPTTKEARRTRAARQKRGLHNHDEHNYQHATASGSTREDYISTSPVTTTTTTASAESDDIPDNQLYYWS